MNRNDKLKQRLTTSVAVGLAAVAGTMQIGALPVYAAETDTSENSKAVYKEETVYVNADALGNRTQITVSDWLKNAGKSASVNDKSTLENIKNVKGEESFVLDGNSLTWDSQGKDIYYQGTTNQELPVSVKLTWYLDGKEISPDELNGKSGQLKVKIDYKNLSRKTVTVDGKQEEVYTPFVMMTGLILPEENCSNVVIDNGRVISDGNRNIVVGFAMPGMKESLGITENDALSSEVMLPESLTISAEVTDFSVPSTFTVALSDLMENIDLDKIADTGDLQTALDDLEDAAIKLVGGTADLSDGADRLSEGIDSYTEGVDQLSSAVSKYLGDDGELSGKVTEYVNGVNTVVLGIKDYTDGAGTLADGVISYINGEEQIADGAEQLADLSKGLQQVQMAIHQLTQATDGKTDNDGGKDLKVASQALADGTQKMKDALGSEAVKKLMSQVDAMTESGQELISQAENLEESMQQGIAEPVQNITSQLQNLSGELQKMTQLQDNLQAACSRINMIVNEDNVTIKDAKTKGSSVRQSVATSVAALEKEKESLQSTDPDAAQKIQDVIDTLNAAGESAGALENLKELDTVQTDQLGDAAIDTEAVAQAADAVRKNMNIFVSTAGELSQQLPVLQNKIEDMKQSVNTLPDNGLTEFSKQVDQLNKGMQQLNAAIGGEGGLSESISFLDQSVAEDFPKAMQGIDALNGGFDKLEVYNSQLLNGAYDLKEAGKTLAGGADTLFAGTNTLSSGLNAIGRQMNEGTSLLTQNSGTLRDGAKALKDGSHTLAESMSQFEEQGTKQLKVTVEEQLGDVVDRLKALNSSEAEYDTFSGKSSSMDGSVKFIIETEAGED